MFASLTHVFMNNPMYHQSEVHFSELPNEIGLALLCSFLYNASEASLLHPQFLQRNFFVYLASAINNLFEPTIGFKDNSTCSGDVNDQIKPFFYLKFLLAVSLEDLS